ncbi:MAG: IclR family transcriptional regulator [Alicyclobacillus macrosporangiidus]|uniref:IclR family transcriptional regulator n=1 Tax=Alicyclobacillus macrosporangiidus TaxID=392015 RepID=UPI0026E9DDDA|nr:IclR family transcriptional regulator [Alicyclobacillus macrosporangiidus]MCL6599724.1 IclR family transcriptional regulator [Alicyclobacillus macrosporangiidus]
MSGRGGVRDGTLVTAAHALRLLRLFSEAAPVLSVSEMSRRLHLPKSVVSRIVTTFAYEGVLEKDELSGRYRLGPVLLELGLIAGDLNPVLRVAEPSVRELRDATQQHSFLVWPDGSDGVCLVAHPAPHSRVAPVHTGMRMPLSESVAGWTVLAFANGSRRREDAAGLPFCGAGTGRLEPVFQDIERRGYACFADPWLSELMTLACPVFDPTGTVVAAVAITGVPSAFAQDDSEQWAIRVSRAARQISSRLFSTQDVPHKGTPSVRS